MIFYILFGISITLNLVTFIGLFIFYKKFMRDNPLSFLYKKPKEENIIDKLKKENLEYWDI